MVGSRPSNRSDKASRRQLPNQPVPKKANANTSIIHQGIANAEDGIHLLPSIGTKRVVTSGPPQLRSISASLCYRKQVDYMEEGPYPHTRKCSCQYSYIYLPNGCEDGQSLIQPSEEAVGALSDPTLGKTKAHNLLAISTDIDTCVGGVNSGILLVSPRQRELSLDLRA